MDARRSAEGSRFGTHRDRPAAEQVTSRKRRLSSPVERSPFKRAHARRLGILHRVGSSQIVCTDGLDLLEALEDESADLVFLDPPFNLGKSYGARGRKGDLVEENAYFAYLWQVVQRAAAVLKPGGALFLYHLPRWALRLSSSLTDRLTFRHWIAISMKNGFARGRQLYPAHYALVYLTKGEPRSFSRPKVPPATCPHCGELTKDYGGYRRFVEGGVNLSDVWDDLSPVRHRKYKSRAANELNPEIPRRVLAIAGRPKGLFVDPFAGSGTALVLAARAGMRCVGSDRESRYVKLVRRRMLSALRGEK